jgi:hypothetical protein
VSVDDVVARRPAQALADGERLCTGKYRFRLLQTPHVPHCWEVSLLFEETQGTLLCSDLFHQNGDVEPSTSVDVVGRFKLPTVSANAVASGSQLTPSVRRLHKRGTDGPMA